MSPFKALTRISLIVTIVACCCVNAPIGCHYQFAHAAANPDTARGLLFFGTTTGATTPRPPPVTTTPQQTLPPPTTSPQEVPYFEEPIGNQTVALGRDAQLSCKINHLGNYRTAWLRVEDKGILTIHNNIITRNYRVGLMNNDDGKNFVLTIKNVQPADKGGYMCQINSVPMKYAIGYLDVLTPPAFEEAPAAGAATTLAPNEAGSGQPSSQLSVREGANVTLSCRAHGHPSPVITWRREDSQPIHLNGLDGGAVSKLEGPSLSFGAAHRVNSGAYLCIASNGVQPSASKRQLLDVQFGPIVTLPQTELGASLGQTSAQLECIVELNPSGSFHWVKLAAAASGGRGDGSFHHQEDDVWLLEHDELQQSDKYEIVIKQINSEKVQMILNIRKIDRQDFSLYKCIARNPLGLQSSSIRLYESSSFSLNNMFRVGISAANQQQQQQQHQYQTTSEEQQQLASGGRQSASKQVANGSQQQRAHTRSSWIQRSSGSTARGHHDASQSDSSAATARGLLLLSAENLLLLLLSNCLVLIITLLPNQQQQHRAS